jgi:hypothetical protein
MAAVDEHQELVSIRVAAAACGVSARTIRRRLRSGAFPGAFKGADPGDTGDRGWRIPVAALQSAGLDAGSLVTAAAENAAAVDESEVRTRRTTLELVGSDHFGRLRAELAEAVAAAELSLARADIARWRAIAHERGRALERADFVLDAVAGTRRPNDVAPEGSRHELQSEPARAPSSTVEIPEHVREEARRYAGVSGALGELHSARRWWRRRHRS